MMLFTYVFGLIVLMAEAKHYGTYIGEFKDRFHDVNGQVYAVDSRTIFIKGFTYDGQGPDAFFYGGSTSQPSKDGYIIPNEVGTSDILKSYDRKDIVLTLPQGKHVRDLKWVSVWCRAFEVNFGEVTFPDRVDYPRPQKIGSFDGVHEVSSGRIVVVDAQTFLIPNFNYDGQAPDAHFWVGSGRKPGPEGILVPDENGSEKPLRGYDSKTLVLVLPGDLTVHDIDWLSLWCIAFFVDFSFVPIPKNLNVPPSLRMLGIEPQTKLNCEILDPAKGFEVRWAIAGRSIVMQLVGRLDQNEYMGFGVSGDLERSRMVGSDATVAWMDHDTGKGYADDYYLGDESQCAGGRGSCPDEKIQRNTNNVRLLNSAYINEFTMLTYRKPLKASDAYDTEIYTNRSQPIVWAIGPVNSKGETGYHTKRLEGTKMLDFARIPRWNCPISKKEKEDTQKSSLSTDPAPAPPVARPWSIPPITCDVPEDGVFFAQIGPTGGENGYSAITRHVGWGIAWYINGLLIPEIYLVRGKTYTFVVESGNDPNSPASFHPLYITDDPEGGYEFKNEEQKNEVNVYAGVNFKANGETEPTAIGRLCEWKETSNKPSSSFSGFGSYQRSLELDCQQGTSGILRWTPDENTPDTVYYQCFTHRFLGWKIHVVDECNKSS